MLKSISEEELNYQIELLKKNNLARMKKDIGTIANPSTTIFENSELVDEGIVASSDPVDNCFKAIFGRKEFDDTIPLAPPPYSENFLESENSTSDKEKLASTPVTNDSVSYTCFMALSDYFNFRVSRIHLARLKAKQLLLKLV